jgi:peptidyl-prolyl cis-trans isomerase C
MCKVIGLLLAGLVGAYPAASLGAEAPPNPHRSAAAPASAAKLDELFPDSVVAKGKGVEIKRSQLDQEVIRFKAQAAGRGQSIPSDHLALMEPQILDQLINIQLLCSAATDEDKAAGKVLVDKQIEEAKTQLGSDEALNRQLKAQGFTRDEFVAKTIEMSTARAVLERALKVKITDEDVKKFYDENPSQFEEPERVRASHILFSTKDPITQVDLSEDKKAAKRKLAEEVLKRAQAGEDFAKLAKDYSEDPGSKDKGGEYVFPRGQMVPPFEAAAFSLNTNQISDIVTTVYGYHIIKLSEKFPARKIELAKVASRVKEYLTGQALQKQSPEYIAKLRKEAAVEILDEKLKLKEPPAEKTALPPGHPAMEPGKKTDKK